jgi:pyruvate/2-oxoglutarate dehydrogenase complex dihydrolipoamide dehydrogenase (E3) component
LMKYDYDVLAIGLGPAGMAVSIMGAAMGLRVCGIEPHKLGGECLNVGCIPSKALLKAAKLRRAVKDLEAMGFDRLPLPAVKAPLKRVREVVETINTTKTRAMFEKVDLIHGEGPARFVDPHTVGVNGRADAAGGRRITAKKIFICTGTLPVVPPIPGLDGIDILTNQNLFHIDDVPATLTVIGGGGIGCEMAQAFSRLGSKVSVIHMDAHLLPAGPVEPGNLLQQEFEAEGIAVHNSARITAAEKNGETIVVKAEGVNGPIELHSDRLLVAAGRRPNIESLDLEKAGVAHTKRGITVDKYLRTSQKHIFAPGDCNGHFLLTHAAMHQGMLALMNAMLPWPFKRDFRKYAVPWAVFTEPEVARVGAGPDELEAQGVKYDVVRTEYADYGRTLADGVPIGFVEVLASPGGRIYGATIVGDGASETIHEFALAMQTGRRLSHIMMLQHAFPSMSFMNKRISEQWMMGKMKSRALRWMVKRMI